MAYNALTQAAGKRIAVLWNVHSNEATGEMMRQIAISGSEDFDTVLLQELKILKNSERRLQRLFPKLRSQPQLRDYFLLELTAVRQRADRLSAVLDPLCELELPAAYDMPTVSPAA